MEKEDTMSEQFQVSVNWDLCESNGVCEAMVPEMFVLDDDDQLQITDPVIADAQRGAVERAVASCPKSALSIVAVTR